MSKKQLTKKQVTRLLKETIENKLFEHKLAEEVNNIYRSRQDLQSTILLNMMEELSGRQIPDPTVLDEGVWEKAKQMLAKIRLSKSTGAQQQRDALEAAADKAASKKFSEMLSQLKAAPGFDKYPNNEKDQEFVGITTGIAIMYNAVKEAHKDGMVETDTANDLISKLKGYVDGLEGDLSYSYRYFNEDEDADDSDDVLEEAPTSGSEMYGLGSELVRDLGRSTDQTFLGLGVREKAAEAAEAVARAMRNAAGEGVDGANLMSDPGVKRAVRKFIRKGSRLAKKAEKGGFTNNKNDALDIYQQTAKELGLKDLVPDAHEKLGIQDIDVPGKDLEVVKNWDSSEVAEKAAETAKKAKRAARAPVEPKAAAPGADQPYDIGPDDPSLGQSDPYYDAGPDAPGLGQSQVMDTWTSGVGDIGGVQDLPKLYAKAGSLKTLSGWLGPGFLQSVAGFALPVAGIAAVGALVGKRLLGKSREGSLKKLSGIIAPVDASEHSTDTPEPTTAEPEAPPTTGGDEEGGGDGGGTAATPAGEPVVTTVNSNNLATRDADGSGKRADGTTVLDEPEKLALAKAQLKWLEANPGKTPEQVNGRGRMKRDLQAAIVASEIGPEKDDETISDDEITKGVKPPPGATPDFGGLAETVNRWQTIAGIIKG